jgi:hypothetical protein
MAMFETGLPLLKMMPSRLGMALNISTARSDSGTHKPHPVDFRNFLAQTSHI